MTGKLRLRPLHRQRQSRHRTVRILSEDELTRMLGVERQHLAARLTELSWPFHRDGAGKIWATERPAR